jgi:hypothetical protein
LIWGFTNSTVAFTTSNSTFCVFKTEEYYTNVTKQLMGTIKDDSFTLPGLILSTTYLLQNVDPTIKACLWTVDETGDAFYLYGFNFEDPERILFNFIYNLGNIYDGSWFLTGLTYETSVSDEEWFSVGKDIGFIFYNVFYNQTPDEVVIDWPTD